MRNVNSAQLNMYSTGCTVEYIELQSLSVLKGVLCTQHRTSMQLDYPYGNKLLLDIVSPMAFK